MHNKFESLGSSRCGIAMRERTRRDISDGICWYCSQCKGTKSIREGSIFAKSRLPLQKWMIAIYWWARQYPVTDCKDEAEISEPVAIDIYQWLREVCSTKLLQTPVVLGGAGVTVQVDESLFRHKPKVSGFYFTSLPSDKHFIAFSTEPPWQGYNTRSLGIWDGRHCSPAQPRIHGNCSKT